MLQDDPTPGGLPAPGEPVFYPKVGHCIYRGVTEDRAAPGKKLVELEDLEEGSRILIPTERVPMLGLRPAGRYLEQIQQELSSEFEPPGEDAGELDIEELIQEGSPRSLAKGLKRLHLARQTTGLSREDEQTRRKIRSWLAAEVAISKDCTRAEAQALITRILQEAMNAHRRKEREEAKERRRQVKAQKAAEDAALKEAEEADAEAARQALFAEADRGQEVTEGIEAVDETEGPPAAPETAEPASEEPRSTAAETPPTDTEPSADDTAGAEPTLEEPAPQEPGEESSKRELTEAGPPTDDDPAETSSDETTSGSHTGDPNPAETP